MQLGVVFWDDLLESLSGPRPGRPPHAIGAEAFRWVDQHVVVDGQPAASLAGYGFSMRRPGTTRHPHRQGARARRRHALRGEVEDPASLDADLVVACDGVNSRLRRRDPDRFGTRIDTGRNQYMWLGTTRVFDAFTFAFVRTEAGWIWCHAYGFDATTSTVIVECSPETWAGWDSGSSASRRASPACRACSRASSTATACSPRRRPGSGALAAFRTVTDQRWRHGNLVLAGDAAHTTHFTIGSGTKLAIEDAIGLASALGAPRRPRAGATRLRARAQGGAAAVAAGGAQQHPVVRGQDRIGLSQSPRIADTPDGPARLHMVSGGS